MQNELFIFEQSLPHHPEVENWFESQPAELYRLAHCWYNRLRACGDDVSDVMHDGCPNACVNHAAFGYVNVFIAHVNVGFFTGAFLPDPEGLLQGSGKRMRHVKLRPGEDINKPALETLITNAYQDVKRRLAD
ncbi:MAG: DUF1801 domain-containing protein [Pseudomonadota bacterium]